MKMQVLHIAVGFNYSAVYKDLFKEISNIEIDQQVYVPEHYGETKATNDQYPFKIYSNEIIKKYDKYLYFTKIMRMRKDIEKNIEIKDVSIIHAHSLFSDGAVAYELYKKYGIPYIVAVRNTDINKYYKYAIHLRGYAEKILLHSENIVFISKAYKAKFIREYISGKNKEKIEDKLLYIPNGVNNFWLKNQYKGEKKLNRSQIKILSVGDINKNKNSLNLIKACNLLVEENKKKILVTLVGKVRDENYYKQLMGYKFVQHINFVDQKKLLKIYRENDIYVMPSINETFGLVYIEAMTQGLPIIYTKGQGIDGAFENGVVGYPVDPRSVQELREKIQKSIENYEFLSNNAQNISQEFEWSKVAEKYKNIYMRSLLL